MPTLKNLVDEVVNVENSIVSNRDTLKQILIDKKVEGLTNENKLSALINKVNDLRSVVKTLYIYNNGIDNVNGFTFHKGSGVFQKNTDHMLITANAVGWGNLQANTYIDSSKYTKLCIEHETYSNYENTNSYCSFSISLNSNSSTSVARFMLKLNGRFIEEFDISNININAIVDCMYSYSSSSSNRTMKIYKIWFEE